VLTLSRRHNTTTASSAFSRSTKATRVTEKAAAFSGSPAPPGAWRPRGAAWSTSHAPPPSTTKTRRIRDTPLGPVGLDPVPQRGVVDPQITSRRSDRLVGRTDQPDSLLTELRWLGRPIRTPSSGAMPNMKVSTEPGQLQSVDEPLVVAKLLQHPARLAANQEACSNPVSGGRTRANCRSVPPISIVEFSRPASLPQSQS